MRLTILAAAVGLALAAPAFADTATITQTGVDNYGEKLNETVPL